MATELNEFLKECTFLGVNFEAKFLQTSKLSFAGALTRSFADTKMSSRMNLTNEIVSRTWSMIFRHLAGASAMPYTSLLKVAKFHQSLAKGIVLAQ